MKKTQRMGVEADGVREGPMRRWHKERLEWREGAGKEH